MKKLLSLLSAITIIGTTIPNVIAASPYKKEETKLENSDINDSQTNNLKKLNRNKRSPQYNPVTGQGGQQQLYNPQTGWGSTTYQQPPQWGGQPTVNQNSNITTPLILRSGRSFPINNDKFYYIGPSTGLLYFHERGSGSIIRIMQINEKINDIVIDENKNVYIIGESWNVYVIVGIYGEYNSRILTIDLSLIKQWKSNFNNWINQINWQESNVFNQMDQINKINWKNTIKLEFANHLHSLKQNLAIINNNINILKLNLEFINLKNDLDNLNNKVNNLISRVDNLEMKLKDNYNNCIANSLRDNTAGNAAGGLVSGAITGMASGAAFGSFAPGIGTIAGAVIGGIIGLISGSAGGLAYGITTGVITC